MITNGIKHDLKIGQMVWSIRCTGGQKFIIEGFTEKRVVCREIDQTGRGYRSATSNHCPSSLFVIERVKSRQDSVIL